MLRRPAALSMCAGAALALAACSKSGPGGSGVPGGTYLDEMTDGERDAFCEWSIARMGGGGEKTCDWGTVVVMTEEECREFPWPHCTVSTEEACAVMLTDACDRGDYDQCTAYQSCAHPDAGTAFDAGSADAGSADAGSADAGSADAGEVQ